MPGLWGIAINIFGCVYLTIIIFFSFWPTEQSVTKENMNYAVLITGAVVILSLTYYGAWARKAYTGPVIGRPRCTNLSSKNDTVSRL